MDRLIVLALLGPLAIVGCGSDEELTDCEAAMKEAHDVDEMQDTVTDVDPAIAACPTLADFVAASERFPNALDGADPAIYVANRCADVATGSLCGEVAGG